MSHIAPLQYAPTPPFFRRARVRTAIPLALLVALSIAGALWGRPAWNKVQLLYWQVRCMSYTAPERQIIWESDQQNSSPNPRAWSNFYRLANANGFNSGGTVFLHERRSPRGNRRLVAIDVYCDGTLLVARVFVPGTLFARPRERADVISPDESLPPGCTAVYAGQPDRHDPSHFTIRYDVAGASHVIDGWLTDDDRVLLEPRRPLARANATASP